MINSLYLDEQIGLQMRGAFVQNKPNVLVLNDFFTKEFAKTLMSEFEKIRSVETYQPEKWRYKELKSKSIEMLASSAELRIILERAIGKKIKRLDFRALQFKHEGYTLLNDAEKQTKGTEFFITIGGEWDSSWGGMSVYTGEQPLIFPPAHNTFVLISPGKSLDFVKYVNYKAGKNWFVKIEGSIN